MKRRWFIPVLIAALGLGIVVLFGPEPLPDMAVEYGRLTISPR